MGIPDGFSGKPSQDKFAATITSKLEKALPAQTFTYNADDFSLTASDGKIVYLTNLYDEYAAASSASKSELISRLLSILTQSEEDFPEHLVNAEEHILIRVRNRAFYDIAKAQMPGNQYESGFAYIPLTDHLCIEAVYDFPKAVGVLPVDKVEGWGITADQAIEIGRKNLREATTTPMLEAAPGFYVSNWDDDYDAARLLLPELIASLEVKGNPVALTPNRATLIVTGSEDCEGLQEMVALGDELANAPRLMTLVPVVYEDEQWKVFSPPQEHPLYDHFSLMRYETDACTVKKLIRAHVIDAVTG